MFITKLVSKVIGDKRQWREYKARARNLPPSYRTALDALERYIHHLGNGGDGTAAYIDLVELFELSAAEQTPVRRIVGADPVEFIETFLRNYPAGTWVTRERDRLTAAITTATQQRPSL